MTIEKVRQIAREKYGKVITDDQAKMYADKYGKLTENELDDVSGGACEYEPVDIICPQCNTLCDRHRHDDIRCPVCGKRFS